MKTKDVTEKLVGRKVKGVFTGLEYTGTVIAIYEDKYSKGLEILFDKPINWGGLNYTKTTTTARKEDDWGSLSNVELI